MKQIKDERFVCLYGLFVEDYPELAYIEDEIKHTRKGDYSIVNWVMDEMDKSGVCKDYADEYNEYNQPTYMQKIKSADGEYILYYDGDGTVEIWGSEYPAKNIVSDSRKIKDENEVLNKLQSNLSEADRFLESPILSRYNCVVVSNDADLTWVVYKNNIRVNDFNINHVDELTQDAAIGAADFYTTGIKDKHPEIEFVVMKKIDFVRKVKDILTDMLDFYLSNTSVSDSKKIKDAKMRKAYLGTIPIGRYFNLQDRDWVVMEHNVLDGTVVCKSVVGDDEMEFQSITEVYMYDISDSRKIKDGNMGKVTKKDVKSALEKAGMGDRVRVYYPDGFVGKIVYNNWKGTYRLEDIKGGLLDEFSNINSASSAIYGEIANGGSIEVADSKRIKDADETQDVLDGILMIAFNDGSEEEGYNEVKKHANEQGELEGVQYETYDVDNQDGVTLIDLCAATDDANAFVKALLTEWGIIDAVADIEFEKSELMENAEEGGEQVSDSKKIKDGISFDFMGHSYDDEIKKAVFELMDEGEKLSAHNVLEKIGVPIEKFNANVNSLRSLDNAIDEFEKQYKEEKNISDSKKINDSFFDDNYGYTNDNEEGVEYNYAVFDFDECEMKDFQYESDAIDFCERNPYAASVMSYDGETIWIKGKGRVSDSRKVNDMTKPAHLRGYAEKYRKKRREQKESCKENEEETQDKEVSDSRRIKDYVVGTKHPQEYFAELRWMLESLKKRGYIDAYLDDDIIKGFAEYYDYPSLREFNEWGDEEVAAGFDEYLESLE